MARKTKSRPTKAKKKRSDRRRKGRSPLAALNPAPILKRLGQIRISWPRPSRPGILKSPPKAPSWLGEVAAIILIVAGILSLMNLFEFSTAPLARSWATLLKRAFGGIGAIVASCGVLITGVLLLLPRAGVQITVPWIRVLAVEIAFISLLALIHLFAGGPDPLTSARMGEGGGYVGWALSTLITSQLDPITATLVYGILFAIGTGTAIGIRSRHLRAALKWVTGRMLELAGRLDRGVLPQEPDVPPESPPDKSARPRRRKRKTGATGPRRLLDRLPPLDLLSDKAIGKPNEREVKANARKLEEALRDFGIETEIVGVKVGPTVTQYAVRAFKWITDEETGEPKLQMVRVRKISSLANDLALALSASSLRIQAPVPGHSYIGIEVPHRKPAVVPLRAVLESRAFKKTRSPLALPLGMDVAGEPVVADLAAMPHLLIAGTTGSGKSVALVSMATALVMRNPPDRLRLVLLDPKMVELVRFNGLPHLMGRVETVMERIIGVLRWATWEMDRRYKLLEAEGARNLTAFNRAVGRDSRLPYIVVMIDEIGDLMMMHGGEVEPTLCRLAQMARAVGIHLVVATQRPSTDVITGLIKANFPARISFAVPSGVDSRVVLDTPGAESLIGRGDMLFLAPDAPGPRRVQGCIVTDIEVERVVSYWERQFELAIEAGEIKPDEAAPWDRGLSRREILAATDELLEEAIALVLEEGSASASLIQRKLGIGYPRAARIMDALEELGVIGPPRPGTRTRKVLIRKGDDPFYRSVRRRK